VSLRGAGGDLRPDPCPRAAPAHPRALARRPRPKRTFAEDWGEDALDDLPTGYDDAKQRFGEGTYNPKTPGRSPWL